jgi:hypothetical protein
MTFKEIFNVFITPGSFGDDYDKDSLLDSLCFNVLAGEFDDSPAPSAVLRTTLQADSAKHDCYFECDIMPVLREMS